MNGNISKPEPDRRSADLKKLEVLPHINPRILAPFVAAAILTGLSIAEPGHHDSRQSTQPAQELPANPPLLYTPLGGRRPF